jgi:hypothetical protein
VNIEHKLYKAVREIVSSHDIIGHTFSESAIGENDEYDAEIYKRYNQGRLYLFFFWKETNQSKKEVKI